MICKDCYRPSAGPPGIVLCPLHEATADLLAATFFADYKVQQRQELLLRLKDDTIQAMQRTIDAQEKNIAVRKEKMGY